MYFAGAIIPYAIYLLTVIVQCFVEKTCALEVLHGVAQHDSDSDFVRRPNANLF